MTLGTRLHTACETLGWSARALSERLGCAPRLVQHWWANTPGYTPDAKVLAWAEARAAELLANPPPTWKRRGGAI
jgi:transcriptional regulator with XRE-family HTH domain